MTSTRRLPGLVLREHVFEVPLHDGPGSPSLHVFGREAVRPDRDAETLPWLVFLQGGPGFGSPRPTTRSGWLDVALRRYRVLLLDQRGTGLSTPITAATLAALPDDAARAEYLGHFRADGIVRDCEHIRAALLGPQERWSVLGQSFGGFVAVHYLSHAPHGLREAFITGGLPPLRAHPDEIYGATYQRLASKNAAYFERYPEDRDRLREVLRTCRDEDVQLPTGGPLTPERVQLLGLAFGMSDGFEAVHYLLEDAFERGGNGPLRDTFLHALIAAQPFETHPLFAVLHEAAYCQGFASRWSAQRVRAQWPTFDPTHATPSLTGEMIYPCMFEQLPALRPYAGAAELLAQREDWPALYDAAVLAKNEVPTVAAIYADDMYVERSFSEHTAASIGGLRPWLTNAYEHNGLRADAAVLERLMKMMHGEA